MKKISFVLISFLIFTIVTRNTYIVYADAGQIVVGGVSIPTGGLSGLDQIAYTAPIFGALLSAFGIGVNISEESQQAGMTKTEYIADQILRWKGNHTNAAANAITEFLGGAQIDVNGMIYLSDYALDLFTQFGNWVVSNQAENFVNYPAITPYDGEVIDFGNNIRFNYYNQKSNVYMQRGTTEYLGVYTNNNVKFFGISYFRNGYYENAIIFPSSTTQVINFYRMNLETHVEYNNSYNTTHSIGQFKIYYSSAAMTTNFFDTVYNSLEEVQALLQSIGNTSFTVESVDAPAITTDTFVGDQDEWIDNLPSLDIPQGYTGAIDPGILTGLENSIAENRDCIISIRDYIEALGEAVNEGVNDVSIPVTDTGTGAIVDVPAVDFPVDFPVYDPVADPDLPSEDELTPAVDPVSPADPEDIIPGATLDLTSIFPFCIPFDLYAIMQKFIAEPEAPNIDIELEIPGIYTIDETYSLEEFDTVALVLRNMEIVLFVIGLAVATRRIYLRG